MMAAPVRKRPFLLRLVFLAVSIKNLPNEFILFGRKSAFIWQKKKNNSIGTDEQEYCDKTL